MSRELTRDEIETAGKLIDKIRREQGDTAGKEAARELKARMIMSGNTDYDSIYYFNQSTGCNWEYL